MESNVESILSRDDMERRRLEAARDLQGGISQAGVARKYGVSRTTASRWCRALGVRGVEALRKRKATGRPSRLSREQLAGIADIFHQSPLAFGIDSGRWTTGRLADAIYQRYGVRYDPDHVGRLLHKLGLREPRRIEAAPPVYYMASRYSPNTDLSRPEISPTVA